MDEFAKEDLEISFKGEKVTLEQRLRKERLNFLGALNEKDKCFIKLYPKENPCFIRAKSALELVVDQGSHSNIMSDFEFGEANADFVYLVSSFDQKDKNFSSKHSFSMREIYEIFIGVCNGLEFPHRNRIIHRDIKPENLIVKTDNKNTFIIDFDFAVINDDFSLDEEDILWGTPYFIAPETWTYQVYSTQSDIYALGISLYEKLTGKFPFEGETVHDIAMAHLNSSFEDPRN